MSTYKQIVLDIEDYISLETAQLEHLLEKIDAPVNQRLMWQAEKEALKDILDIIVRDGGK